MTRLPESGIDGRKHRKTLADVDPLLKEPIVSQLRDVDPAEIRKEMRRDAQRQTLAARRPAETGAAGAAVLVLLADRVGVELSDDEALAAIAVVGLVPAAVTYCHARGGLRGILRRLWKGDRS